MSDEKPKSMTELASAAGQQYRSKMRLFSRTELANIPHTDENMARAIEEIRYICEQTKALLGMSAERRGMYLCWLKVDKTQHGEWQAFCEENFPHINMRSIQRWMAAYLQATGEKKPKSLPKYDEGDLEDAELAESVEQLSTDKQDLAPRRALVDLTKKQEKQLEKGKEQYEQLKAETAEKISRLQEELEAERSGQWIPPEAREEADRIECIRGHFGAFLMKWIQSLPDNTEALKLHRELHHGLCERLQEFWETQILPHGMKIKEAEDDSRGKK